ncbi:transglutaminase-like domain-containing protein [Colwellia sp. MEBiC06753]
MSNLEDAPYLKKDVFFDYEHPSIDRLAQQVPVGTKKQQAIAIYYIVRDGFRYNPYSFVEGEHTFSATFCIEQGEGYCIPKASLMVALCRKFGIPARLGLADVTNHLSSPKLLELLGTNVFSMHGYVEVKLNDKWVKATPAFNRQLCEKMNSEPLEFDGENDSVFQEFSSEGHKLMEYLNDWGTFESVPTGFIFANFHKHYPHIMKNLTSAILFKDAAFNE